MPEFYFEDDLEPVQCEIQAMNARTARFIFERAKSVAAVQEARSNRRKIAALRTRWSYFRLMSSARVRRSRILGPRWTV
jgi:hypothetical protein